MTHRMVIAIAIGLWPAALLSGASDELPLKGPKQSFEVTTTEHIPFQPGGTIRLENSYGYLTVEGWDEPEVEFTMTKSTDRFYAPPEKEKAEKRFPEIQVTSEHPSNKEYAITTTTPVRSGLFTSKLPSGATIVTRPLLPNNKRGITVEYRVRVPRDSKLVVRHDNGYVWVSDLTGELEVHSHTGDMIVALPDPGPDAIDARTGLGTVTSDFAGDWHNWFLFGTGFTYPGNTPARRVHLRMGRGSITIKKGPPIAPVFKN